AAGTFFGLKPQDCVGLMAVDFVHPDERETTQEAFTKWLRDKTEDTAFENRQVSRDGNVAHMLWTTRLVFDESGDIAWIDGIARDITERKQAEDEMERVFNMTNYMVCIASLDGYFTRANSSFEEILGYSSAELLSKPFFEFVHPDDKEKTIAVIKEELSRGAKVIAFENRYQCKDGSYKWLSWTSQPVPEENITFAIAYDITDRKQAEQEREELFKAIELKNEEMQSILYTVSHDLKSPLVNINGFSGMLDQYCQALTGALKEFDVSEDAWQRIRPIIDEEIPEALSFITAGTDKMKKLLDGLLQVSRVGTDDIHIEKVDMNRLMHEITDTFTFQIKEKDVSVTVDDLPGCRADVNQVNHVFSNLLSNALKYLAPDRKGVIRISGRVSGSECIYGIEDNGIGINKAHQSKVFELFHRLHPDDSTDSQGLGLTIARRALTRNAGRIWVESEEGKGSTFFVSLPTA
ncbi:MAG: PAS domain S-box protein, partial [Planctomycetes bacterium]|nr:PAS domain S-box protein [Planctomycetota bacterium]